MAENEEEPIVTLKGNVRLFYIINVIMTFTLVLMMINIFQVIIACDISAGLLYDNNKYYRSILVFYLSILVTLSYPFMRLLDLGNTYSLYSDRLAIKKYLSKKTIVIPYKKMHAEIKNKKCILITTGNIPSLFSPIKRYIVVYYKSCLLPLKNYREHKWNYDDLEKAINIIENKAAVVVKK